MSLQQVLQAPLPPLPPGFPGPGGPPVEIVVIIALLVFGVILFPIARALARRIEGRSLDLHARAELDELRARVAELDQLHHRVGELEERVDFSERLLTQRGENQMLKRGEG